MRDKIEELLILYNSMTLSQQQYVISLFKSNEGLK